MYVEACRDQMVQGPPDPRSMVMTQKWKSNIAEVAPNCPRCASPYTKFCYYNNYSLSQPRYFCKACRRYWTKGGSLRNVPVGGGCRKRRRPNPARKTQPPSSTTITPTTTTSVVPPPSTSRSDGDDGSVIDLAAVFHTFLNQNSISGNSGTELLVGSHLAEDSNASLEFSSSLSVTTQGGDHLELLSGVPDHWDQKEGQMQVQEYCVGHDPETLGSQTMLSTDELVADDFLWSDFGWQPMVQLQEFGWDDQSKINSDNCSLFDLSG